MEDAQRIAFGEAIDRLITVDVGGRGAIPILYGAARARQGRPLALTATTLEGAGEQARGASYNSAGG